MRSALDAWLLSGGVGGDVCDVAHVQGGILRVSRGRGVARLVIGVVIHRGVVGPAKREYRLLESGLRAVARATQGIDGAGDTESMPRATGPAAMLRCATCYRIPCAKVYSRPPTRIIDK